VSIVCVVSLSSVCLLLQDLLQRCSWGGRRREEDMCYERRRAEACVDESAHHALVNTGVGSRARLFVMPNTPRERSVCVFITAGPITKLFAGGGRRRVEDMCYDRR
jgi:hypothetical protein